MWGAGAQEYRKGGRQAERERGSTAAPRCAGESGTTGWEACPEWDSNPHCTRFELARSTGWRIRAAQREGGVTDGGPGLAALAEVTTWPDFPWPLPCIVADLGTLLCVTTTQSRVVIAEDEAL